MTREHGWNHAQCVNCWLSRWGLTREPVRVVDPEIEQCCYCGAETGAGIYVRAKPGTPDIAYCPDYLGVIYGPWKTPTGSPATGHPDADQPASPPSA